MAKTQTATKGVMAKPTMEPTPAKPKITATLRTITRGAKAIVKTTIKEKIMVLMGDKNSEKIICAPLKTISQRKTRKKTTLALPLFLDKKIKIKTKATRIKRSDRF